MNTHLPWHRAATLPERLVAGAPTDVDDERGAKRLAMWTELAPFTGDPDTLDQRMQPLGVTAGRLVALLGETDNSLSGRLGTEPDWHSTFRRWWNTRSAVPANVRSAGSKLGLGLLEVARPLIEGAQQEFGNLARRRLTAVDPSGLDPVVADFDQVIDVLRDTLPLDDLLNYLYRTLVLELNVARVEDRLTGDDSQQRFESFVRILATEAGAMAIWQEYPVLARLVVDQLTFWLHTRLDLLSALIEDLPDMRATVLAPHQPQRLQRVDFGAGDRHRRGRSVAVVRLDTGPVVFKPRDLSMDLAFDRILGWLNDSGLPHPVRRVRVLGRQEHGWVEFVDTTVRTDATGGDRYAWRLGALTAVLYLLHATDFHFENILAAGEHPVLVDLEALLHTDKSAAVIKIDGVADVAATTLSDSVQSIGVLPNRMLVRGEDGTFGLDVSALGGRGGQLTPMPVPFWEDSGTDSMRLVNRRLEMDAERNHPLAEDGQPLDLVGRADQFIDGFNEAYARLQIGTDSLLAPDGPMAAFGTTRTRFIARPTHIYGRLLLESTHPDFLRDALDRDRSLARLCAGHGDVEGRNLMIRDEIAELRLGDVPMFTIDAQDGTLYAGLHDEPIAQRTPPPLEIVVERTRSLSESDRRFQEWVIRSCMAATVMGGNDAQWPNWRRQRKNAGLEPEQFAAEAQRIARRLCDLALRDDTSIGWIGLGLVDEAFWQLAPAPFDTYIGITGIAHALDAVAVVTGDEQAQTVALAVFDQVATRCKRIEEALRDTAPKPGNSDIGIGAFSPLGGMIYGLAHAAARHDRPHYADAAHLLVPSLITLAENDIMLDVVSGAAGAILALLSLETVAPDRGALDAAKRCADRLLLMRREVAGGWGWVTPINPDLPLAGFSHGASGIAVAFARLNEVCPHANYREAILQSMRYEATTYDDGLRNWRDLRLANVGGRNVMNAWCHGAPGVALARHELLRLGVAPELGEGLETDRHRAVLAAFATGLNLDPVSGLGNHSLCHGDVGNLVILDDVHRPDREPELHELLPRIWHTLLAEGRENRWLSGVPYGVETPGMMTGIAGIAWGLARHADPAALPNILTLEVPR